MFLLIVRKGMNDLAGQAMRRHFRVQRHSTLVSIIFFQMAERCGADQIEGSVPFVIPNVLGAVPRIDGLGRCGYHHSVEYVLGLWR